MIPSVLSQHVEQGVKDFLRTTFPVTTPFFEGVLDRLLEGPGNVFKGPYLDIQLPFLQGTGGASYFPDLPMPNPPYLHQEKSFDRLSGENPKPTIVATGTGSGKTECFLYPILDYCYRHRNEPGIKAILIYPMNALATDQAGRLAELIYKSKLRSHVTAGIYVGQQEKDPSMFMQPERLISDKATLRLSPPDILLTNYKMLDYLLIRPDDKPLWQINNAETLRFLVVDELHTFDGAQGSDLGCLIRRLKARLNIEPGHLCCVGTSATLGNGDAQDELLEYSSAVFGETYTKDAIISESRLSAGAFLEDCLIPHVDIIPFERAEELDPASYDNYESYIGAQYKLWFGAHISGEFGHSEWRVELAAQLKEHLFFHNLIKMLKGKMCGYDSLLRQFEKVSQEFKRGDHGYQVNLLNSILALISEARNKVASTSEDGLLKEEYRPFLNVRVQLWLRELRRMVCEVSEKPELRFADDLHEDQLNVHLPLVHCRECGCMGWSGLKRQNTSAIMGELKTFYQAFFKHDPKIVFLFPEKQGVREQELRIGMYHLCPACLNVTTKPGGGGCPNCEHPKLILVHMPDTRVKRGSRQVSMNDCPYCNSRNSLTLLGSRAASLTSVMIVQLFSSTYNDDKKLLTFSDNVQDAAHRAGFFNGRTYRFNFRSALQKFVLDEGNNLSLADAPAAFISYWKNKVELNRYIATFLAPNMEWLKDYELLQQTGSLPDDSSLVQDIDRRVGWEILSEYGYQARIGRTLEKTGSSVVYLDPELLGKVTTRLLELLQNEFESLRSLDEDRLSRFLLGLLVTLKNQGGISHPALKSYIEDFGNTFLLNRQIWMPNFGQNSRSPSFLTTKKGTRFDTLYSSSPTHRTWYLNWAEKSFHDLTVLSPGGESVSKDIYQPVLAALVKENILEERESKGEHIWAIRPEALKLSTKVSQLRCNECGHNISVAEEESELFAGELCLRFDCHGKYSKKATGVDYYGKLYATGDVARIFAREHTGLLNRPEREQLEIDFKAENGARKPWYPNLLSCTPTLEMGIDIGSLSSLVLCSVPPGQANYLQRIGRAGRRDGNALTLTVANARPHDLYFFAEPEEMLAGNVESPGIYLDASAVLERQFTAFCFDRWVATTDGVLLPAKLQQVLSNLVKVDLKKFPHNFINFIETHQVDLFDKFLALFSGNSELSSESVQHLKAFVEGDRGWQGSLQYRIMNGLHGRKQERDSLKKKASILTNKIKQKKSGPKDKNYEDELRELMIEKSALVSLVRSINERRIYNYFTDEGLLPNYAFPEVGVMLRSLIYRKKTKVQAGEGSYDSWHYEYERPAVSAIQELAPANTFYAGGRRVKVDQVDMAVSDVETWRFCDNCSHKELVGIEEEKENCIVCGSPMWAERGQKQLMLKMRQVFASTADRQSRISDDSDDRDPVFFNKQMLVEFDEKQVLDAYKVEADFPFGFDFLSKVDFCEINFGEVSDVGKKNSIAGKEAVRKGFSLCTVCGKVQEENKPPVHDYSCTVRDKTTEQNLIDCIYLYRQFTSEAIRILLPVSIIEESDKKLQSLIAAIQLGLKLKFKGKIDHLQSAVHEEPLTDSTLKRKYLVLYDTVPGGTGYLKQLMRTQEQLLDVLDMALQALRSCSCVQEPGKDGCYRCLFAYRNSYNMAETSRDTAISLLTEILSYRENLIKTQSIRNISFNTFIESELEARFIGALKLYRSKELSVVLKNDLVGGKPGYFLKVGEKVYYIEPQVELGQGDGVSIPSRADFVIRPARMEQGGKPVAVFLDGYAYHRDRVGFDMAQRMAIAQSDKFHVWSLSWNDVENKFKAKNHFYRDFLNLKELPSGNLADQLLKGYDIDDFNKFENLNSFDLFFEFLQNPDSDKWQQFAFTLSLLHIDRQRFVQPEAVEEWTKESEKILPYMFSEKLNESGCPCLYGAQESCYENNQSAVRLFLVAEQAAFQLPGDPFGVRLGCWLNDAPGQREHQDFKLVWNGYLRLYNFLQFLPGAYFVTSEGVVDSAYDGLKFLSQPFIVASKDEKINEADLAEWQEIKELTDDFLHTLLDSLSQHGWVLPEVGYELEGKDGEIIAEGELAWEDRKIVFLLDHEMEYQQVFIDFGWYVFQLNKVLESPDEYLTSFKNKKE